MRFRCRHRIYACQMRQPGKTCCWLLLAACLVLRWGGSVAAADKNPTDRAGHHRLDLQDKLELQRKQERFRRLSPAEQDRLRRLHATLSSDPQGARLQQVMLRYTEWLKTLSAGERAELLELPPEERIERIRQIKQQQAARDFPRYVSMQLEPADVRHILAWLDEYIQRHEQQILSGLPSEVRQRIQQIQDDRVRRRMLIIALQRVGPNDAFRVPALDEVRELADRLSPRLRQALMSIRENGQKLKLLRQWVRAAVASRFVLPSVSDEEIQHFYARQLTREQRDRLESLPRERMHQELRRMYFQYRWKQRIDQQRPLRRPRGGSPLRDERPDGTGGRQDRE